MGLGPIRTCDSNGVFLQIQSVNKGTAGLSYVVQKSLTDPDTLGHDAALVQRHGTTLTQVVVLAEHASGWFRLDSGSTLKERPVVYPLASLH